MNSIITRPYTAVVAISSSIVRIWGFAADSPYTRRYSAPKNQPSKPSESFRKYVPSTFEPLFLYSSGLRPSTSNDDSSNFLRARAYLRNLSSDLWKSCKSLLITSCNSYRSPSPSAIHRPSNVATLSSYLASTTSPPNDTSTNARKHLLLEWARSPSAPQPASSLE